MDAALLDWRAAAGPAASALAESDVAEDGALLLPAVADPAGYAAAKFHGYNGDTTGEHHLKFAKGTTTLAFKYQGGVVVSVDSRSTQGPYIGPWPTVAPRRARVALARTERGRRLTVARPALPARCRGAALALPHVPTRAHAQPRRA